MNYDGIDIIIQNLNECFKQLESYKITPQLQNAIKEFSNVTRSLVEDCNFDFLSEAIEEYLKTSKEDENLSVEEFETKYISEKTISEKLGRAGWVISEYGNPNDVLKWNALLEKGKSDEIAQFFQGEDQYVLEAIFEELKKIYSDRADYIYYTRGYSFFKEKDYMTSAMYLVGLLEQRCKKQIDFGEYKKYKVIFSSKGFEKHLLEKYKLINSHMSKRFLFLEMYPSLISFLNRLFDDGEYTFEKGIEPPYINRNWLLHGKTTRIIEEYECIQLFNALSVLEFVCKVNCDVKECLV